MMARGLKNHGKRRRRKSMESIETTYIRAWNCLIPILASGRMVGFDSDVFLVFRNVFRAWEAIGGDGGRISDDFIVVNCCWVSSVSWRLRKIPGDALENHDGS